MNIFCGLAMGAGSKIMRLQSEEKALWKNPTGKESEIIMRQIDNTQSAGYSEAPNLLL